MQFQEPAEFAWLGTQRAVLARFQLGTAAHCVLRGNGRAACKGEQDDEEPGWSHS